MKSKPELYVDILVKDSVSLTCLQCFYRFYLKFSYVLNLKAGSIHVESSSVDSIQFRLYSADSHQKSSHDP